MAKMQVSMLSEIVSKYEKEILADWLKEQQSLLSTRSDIMKGAEIKQQSEEFIELFSEALQNDQGIDISAPAWHKVRELLESISRSRTIQGFSPSETASFIFSLKQPVFKRIQQHVVNDPQALMDEIWRLTLLLDKLGLYTTELYMKVREDIISRQQREMVELSTPVVQLWNGILALPLIGTLDSERTQIVMESLLTKIVETGSYVSIIDITGVPTVDTLVAQHLLKTVAAARLMGAECIISGIRPQIAQTIVHLGVELNDVTTKATMAEAFRVALQRNGLMITKAQTNGREK